MKAQKVIVTLFAAILSAASFAESSFTLGDTELPVFSGNKYPKGGAYNPYKKKVQLDVLAAGGTGCKGGDIDEIAVINENTILIDFGQGLSAAPKGRRSIDRAFCSLALALSHKNKNKKAVVTGIIAVGEAKLSSGSYAKTAVQAKFSGEPDTVKVEATQNHTRYSRQKLDDVGDYEAEANCHEDQPLNVKASVLLRKSRNSSGRNYAAFAGPVILKIEWKNCGRYSY